MEINKKDMPWQKITCLNGKICLHIPKHWKSPAEERVSKRFPYYQKPQEVFMSPEGSQIFTVNLLDKPLKEKEIYSAIWEIQRLINWIYPESIQDSSIRMKTKIGTAGWFSFLTGGIEGDLFHMMFVMSIQEKMLFGSYHFSEEEKREERKIFKKIVEALREGEEME